MRSLIVVTTALLLTACAAGTVDSLGHESHRDAVANGKIDYPYWDAYLLQHGESETLAHFEAVLAEIDEEGQVTLVKSFERFCRFQGCLEGYRAKQGAEGPN